MAFAVPIFSEGFVLAVFEFLLFLPVTGRESKDNQDHHNRRSGAANRHFFSTFSHEDKQFAPTCNRVISDVIVLWNQNHKIFCQEEFTKYILCYLLLKAVESFWETEKV